jgi:hypothetical protein
MIFAIFLHEKNVFSLYVLIFRNNLMKKVGQIHFVT